MGAVRSTKRRCICCFNTEDLQTRFTHPNSSRGNSKARQLSVACIKLRFKARRMLAFLQSDHVSTSKKEQISGEGFTMQFLNGQTTNISLPTNRTSSKHCGPDSVAEAFLSDSVSDGRLITSVASAGSVCSSARPIATGVLLPTSPQYRHAEERHTTAGIRVDDMAHVHTFPSCSAASGVSSRHSDEVHGLVRAPSASLASLECSLAPTQQLTQQHVAKSTFVQRQQFNTSPKVVPKKDMPNGRLQSRSLLQSSKERARRCPSSTDAVDRCLFRSNAMFIAADGDLFGALSTAATDDSTARYDSPRPLVSRKDVLHSVDSCPLQLYDVILGTQAVYPTNKYNTQAKTAKGAVVSSEIRDSPPATAPAVHDYHGGRSATTLSLPPAGVHTTDAESQPAFPRTVHNNPLASACMMSSKGYSRKGSYHKRARVDRELGSATASKQKINHFKVPIASGGSKTCNRTLWTAASRQHFPPITSARSTLTRLRDGSFALAHNRNAASSTAEYSTDIDTANDVWESKCYASPVSIRSRSSKAAPLDTTRQAVSITAPAATPLLPTDSCSLQKIWDCIQFSKQSIRSSAACGTGLCLESHTTEAPKWLTAAAQEEAAGVTHAKSAAGVKSCGIPSRNQVGVARPSTQQTLSVSSDSTWLPDWIAKQVCPCGSRSESSEWSDVTPNPATLHSFAIQQQSAPGNSDSDSDDWGELLHTAKAALFSCTSAVRQWPKFDLRFPEELVLAHNTDLYMELLGRRFVSVPKPQMFSSCRFRF